MSDNTSDQSNLQKLRVRADQGLPKIPPMKAMKLMQGFKIIAGREGAQLKGVQFEITADPQSVRDLKALVQTLGMESEILDLTEPRED